MAIGAGMDSGSNDSSVELDLDSSSISAFSAESYASDGSTGVDSIDGSGSCPSPRLARRGSSSSSNYYIDSDSSDSEDNASAAKDEGAGQDLQATRSDSEEPPMAGSSEDEEAPVFMAATTTPSRYELERQRKEKDSADARGPQMSRILLDAAPPMHCCQLCRGTSQAVVRCLSDGCAARLCGQCDERMHCCPTAFAAFHLREAFVAQDGQWYKLACHERIGADGGIQSFDKIVAPNLPCPHCQADASLFAWHRPATERKSLTIYSMNGACAVRAGVYQYNNCHSFWDQSHPACYWSSQVPASRPGVPWVNMWPILKNA